MASGEVENPELLKAPGGGTPESQEKPERVDNSVYQPMDRLQDYQRILHALGAIQILNGAMILALGIFLGLLLLYSSHLFRYFFFLTLYTGYPLWGAVLFISSGSLSLAAGRKPTRRLMQNSFGMNIASATVALTGIVFLSIHLAVNNQLLKSCGSSQAPDACIYLGFSSNGLVSLMLSLTLLELGITISLSVMWCKATVVDSREAMSSSPHSVESGIPPDEGNAESTSAQH